MLEKLYITLQNIEILRVSLRLQKRKETNTMELENNEEGNGDVPGVASENDNDEATSKMDGKASADSETEGSTTTSATDEAGAKEETSDDIVQEEPAAA